MVGAASVALVVVAAPGFTRHLPVATLAAVVIAAVLTVADVRGTLRLLRMRPSDFALSLSAFAGVAMLGVLQGIAVAIALSLGAFVARAWRPYMAELVRLERRKGYHDRARHPEGRRVPGLVIEPAIEPETLVVEQDGAKNDNTADFVPGVTMILPGDEDPTGTFADPWDGH